MIRRLHPCNTLPQDDQPAANPKWEWMDRLLRHSGNFGPAIRDNYTARRSTSRRHPQSTWIPYHTLVLRTEDVCSGAPSLATSLAKVAQDTVAQETGRPWLRRTRHPSRRRKAPFVTLHMRCASCMVPHEGASWYLGLHVPRHRGGCTAGTCLCPGRLVINCQLRSYMRRKCLGIY